MRIIKFHNTILRVYCMYDSDNKSLSNKLSQGLYGIIEAPTLQECMMQAKILIEGNVPVIQVRAKQILQKERFELGMNIIAKRKKNQLIIMNDRLDFPLLLNADGAHLGQSDLPPVDARKLLTSSMLLGYSTHNLEQVKEAQSLPVDYLGFGPIFETKTKNHADSAVGIDLLHQACKLSLKPIVAIGGIRLDSLSDVIAAGARSAVMISGIFDYDSPEKMIASANAIIKTSIISQ